jgi:hypothetical membrane protein
MQRTDDMNRKLQPLSKSMALGGVFWVLSLTSVVGQVVAQAAWKAPYSLIDNTVSDLGNTSCTTGPYVYTCSPLHTLMNVIFVATGVLLLLGLVLTRRTWPRRRLTTWGLAFVAVTGIGTVLVGISPENLNLAGHVAGALNIPCGSIAMLLLGLAIRHDRPAAARFSLLLAAVGFLGLLSGPLLVVLTGHGGGLAERVALYPQTIWTVVFGILFLRSAGGRSPRDPEGRPGSAAPPIRK